MPIVPGFKYDLFISYAHANDEPWGWVSEFIKTLQAELKGKNREFNLWWDPGLRTGEDFNLAIANAISESAVFLCVLSTAYAHSTYCNKEVEEFRQQRHPAFGLTVGTFKRMQAIIIDSDFPKESWPPELRSTSPCPFCSESEPLFSKPPKFDSASPWVKSLWKVRDSIWATLDEMQKRKKSGTAVERSYGVASMGTGLSPTVYLAEVTDDLYLRRENLRTSLAQASGLQVVPWAEAEASPSSGLDALSVHLFGLYAGRPHAGAEESLPRLQLEATVAANPARRPLVWLAHDLEIETSESEAHKQFLSSLINRSDVEALRMDFEDLKDEVGRRMRHSSTTPIHKIGQNRDDPIVHIWHQANDSATLGALKDYLHKRNCAFSVFNYASSPPDRLQSRLVICDGLVVPYSLETKAWAEDILMDVFSTRRREERPIAFAAVELLPPSNEEFNFEHPRVVSVHAAPSGSFQDMDVFLSKLEQADV